MLTGSALIFCLFLAFVCFVLAALGVKGPAGGWTPVGLIFLTLAFVPEFST